jgi:hypothetical protein
VHKVNRLLRPEDAISVANLPSGKVPYDIRYEKFARPRVVPPIGIDQQVDGLGQGADKPAQDPRPAIRSRFAAGADASRAGNQGRIGRVRSRLFFTLRPNGSGVIVRWLRL